MFSALSSPVTSLQRGLTLGHASKISAERTDELRVPACSRHQQKWNKCELPFSPMFFPIPSFVSFAWHVTLVSFFLPSSTSFPPSPSIYLSLCLSLSFYSPPSFPAYPEMSSVPPPPHPPNSYPPRICEYGLIWKWSFRRCHQVEMRSHRSRMGPKSKTTHVLVRRGKVGHRDTGRTPHDDGGRDGGMLLRAKRYQGLQTTTREAGSHGPKSSKEALKRHQTYRHFDLGLLPPRTVR